MKGTPTKQRKHTTNGNAPSVDGDDGGRWNLRLYVAGQTPRSLTAFKNLKDICEEYLPGHYDLEVIDIYQRPDLAAGQQIIAAPTLVKESPGALRRMIGNLSNTRLILQRLGIAN